METTEWKYRLRDNPEQRYCTVRASGGYKCHKMDLMKGTTLCGHQHGKRGKWVFLANPAPGNYTCDECFPKPTVKRIKRTRSWRL